MCWLYNLDAKALYAASTTEASEAWKELLKSRGAVAELDMPKDFEKQFSKDYSLEYEIDAASLNYWACEARKRRNNFFNFFPELKDDDYIKARETEKVEQNPNGSVDFWVAVEAFKARSFLQHEANLVWYERKDFDKAEDLALELEQTLAGPSPSEVAAWRNVWIQVCTQASSAMCFLRLHLYLTCVPLPLVPDVSNFSP